MKTKEVREYPKIRLRRGTKMLCPECGTMQVAEFQNEKNSVFLNCRHLRTPALLDPAPGHISFEQAMANPSDPLVRRLFPIVDANGFRPRGRDITDVLDDVGMQAKREAWAA
jgi:hypothetical protein